MPAVELTKLRRFVEAEGAYLHAVRPDQIAMLAVSTDPGDDQHPQHDEDHKDQP